MKKKRFQWLPTAIVILILLAGLSLLLYPTASDYWNKLHQSQAVMEYAEAVNLLDNERLQKMWDEAVKYNEALYAGYQGVDMTSEVNMDYSSILNVTGDGMMSTIDIPSIKCKLPVYHGTNSVTLQSFVGHLKSSSLPVGGENTHCVLSGHTGLPSARLFTDLEKVQIGDYFVLQTLGVNLAYEVDQILVVLPDEMDALQIEAGKDLCTLVTCTPYGVNSHRLLVRGHRIDVPKGYEDIQKEMNSMGTYTIEPLYIVLSIVSLFLLILIIILFAKRRKKKKKEGESREKDS